MIKNGLYVIATPIGNFEDMTLRAISTLKCVDVIAAEDTRHSAKLLQHFGINTTVMSCHNYNEKAVTERLLEHLAEGRSVGLISDAGTPLISDPGFLLVREARKRGYSVFPIPGASALIAALSVAGLPTTRFIFEGFLPAKSSARKIIFEKYKNEVATIVFYESPHRIINCLEDMSLVLGLDRYVVLARELTKTYETVYGAPLGELLDWVAKDSNQQKGEFVILLDAPAIDREFDQRMDDATQSVLTVLLAELPLKQAVNLAAKITGRNKNELYDYALSLRG